MMTKYLFLIFGIALLSCSGDNNNNSENPYLTRVSFQYEINLALPQFDNLRFPGGSVYVASGGVRGFFVYNLSASDYRAWEASCPNHSPNDCSTMEISGALAECSCEEYQYSLATGQILSGENLYGMLNYRVSGGNGVLVVSN